MTATLHATRPVDTAPDATDETVTGRLPNYVWTKKEAAKILRCGLTKITALCTSKTLGSIRVGGMVLIPDVDLRAYISRLRTAEGLDPQEIVSA